MALWECREEAGDQGDVSKVDEEPPDVVFGVAFLAVESGDLSLHEAGHGVAEWGKRNTGRGVRVLG